MGENKDLEMEDFNSETDSDYASYWRDWVGLRFPGRVLIHVYLFCPGFHVCPRIPGLVGRQLTWDVMCLVVFNGQDSLLWT